MPNVFLRVLSSVLCKYACSQRCSGYTSSWNGAETLRMFPGLPFVLRALFQTMCRMFQGIHMLLVPGVFSLPVLSVIFDKASDDGAFRYLCSAPFVVLSLRFQKSTHSTAPVLYPQNHKYVIQDAYNFRSDPLDNRIIRFNNCIQCASIVCDCLAICNKNFRHAANLLDCFAYTVWLSVMGCMTAQLFAEYDFQRARRDGNPSESSDLPTDPLKPREKATYSTAS